MAEGRSVSSVAAAVWNFIKAQWLSLCFVVAVLVAMLAPAPGKAVVSVEAGPFRLFEMIPIILVFLISGLTLNTKDMTKALKHWPGVVWGFVVILGVTPCLGFALRELPLTPAEFAAGLVIFSAAPTTLGVGGALTRACRGNDTLSSMLMTGTSMLSVFTIPLWLKAMLGSTVTASNGDTLSIDINIGKMFWQLAVTMLLPAVVGKALREFVRPAQRFATRFKEPLSMFSVACLAFIVWQTLSGAQEQLVAQTFVDIVYVILAAIGMHVVYLIFNAVVLRFVFSMPIEEAIAVWVMGSQKAAPVAVTAITYLTKDVATQGLLSVPCIIGQLGQVFIGAAVAPWVAKQVLKVQEARKVAAEEGDANGGDMDSATLKNGLDKAENGVHGQGAQPTVESDKSAGPVTVTGAPLNDIEAAAADPTLTAVR